MKSLIIGDIHDLVDLIQIFLKKYEKNYDEIIFVGDYFDSFGNGPKMAEKTAYWLKESLTHPNRKHIFGNHDLHYKFWRNHFIRGSGYSRNKADVINKIMENEDWKKLLFFYETQGFLISHAGISKHLAHPIFGLDTKYLKCSIEGDYKNMLPAGLSSPFLSPGEARGGWQGTIGGITWLDWNLEFKPIRGVNQICGHSWHENIQYKNYDESINVCIDTLPHSLLEIDNGKLKEIKLKF